jgi:hypothetical protein
MFKSFAFFLAMFVITDALAFSEKELLGTWKLVTAVRKNVDGSQVKDAYGGPHPIGYINYGSDHRMMAMVEYDNRVRPARVDQTTPETRSQLYSTTWAYGGTFEVNGNVIQHHVDVSSNGAWTGTTVTRDIAYDGPRLVLTTRPQLSSDGQMVILTLTWEKVAP